MVYGIIDVIFSYIATESDFKYVWSFPSGPFFSLNEQQLN